MLLLGLMLAGVSSAWAGTITFSDLNLENGVQYTSPFDGGDFTVTFAGGSNDGKYYTTGTGIRVYGGGSMTITAKSGNITNIVLTYDSSYKPTSNDVVSTGTYNNTSSTWTGSASSVVFTRPSGSGHWRVQSIEVTVTAGGSDPTPGDEPGDDPTPSETEATVTLDFTQNGWDLPTSSTSISNGEYTDGDYTVTINGTGYFQNKDKYLLLGKSGATLTLPAFSFNVNKIVVSGRSGASGSVVQNIYVGEEAVSTETAGATGTNEYAIAKANQEAGTIYVLKVSSSHNTQITKIEIYGYENVAVGEAGYATYASDNNLDYTSVTGLKAYKAAVSENTVSFSAATEVPAAEGVLLKGDEGTYQVPIIPSAAAITNDFVRGTGAAVASEVDGTYNFILNKVNDMVAFYAANGKVVAKNRAYLQTTTAPAAARLAIVFDDEATTGVTEIVNSKLSNSKYFDLQGRRVAQPTKGLYIVNGKKVIIK